jgi:hypothetical protein
MSKGLLLDKKRKLLLLLSNEKLQRKGYLKQGATQSTNKNKFIYEFD